MIMIEIEEIFNDFDECVCVLLIDYFFEEVVWCIDGCLILIIMDEVWVYFKILVFVECIISWFREGCKKNFVFFMVI